MYNHYYKNGFDKCCYSFHRVSDSTKKKHDALLALILKTLSLQNYGSYGWV